MKSSRDICIDLIRVIACFIVVFSHCIQDLRYIGIHSNIMAIILDVGIFRASVPLFAMISGYLFAATSYKSNLKENLVYGLKKSLKLYLGCIPAYLLACLFNGRSIDISSIMTLDISNILYTGHLWYIAKFMVYVYILTFFWRWLFKDDKISKIVLYALVAGSLYIYTKNGYYVLTTSMKTGYIDLIYPLFKYMIYILIGGMIYQHKDRVDRMKKVIIPLCISGIIFAIVMLSYMAYGNGIRPVYYMKYVGCFDNGIVLLESLGIFLLCRYIKVDQIKPLKKMVEVFADKTLEIYLWHMVGIYLVSLVWNIDGVLEGLIEGAGILIVLAVLIHLTCFVYQKVRSLA